MRFLTTFNQSLTQAADRYDQVHKLLARRFVDAVDEAVTRIEQFPKIGRKIKFYRILPLSGFPYSICYAEDKDGVMVALVLHHHKKDSPQIDL